MKLPEIFLQSLEGVPGFDRETFIAVHEREEGVTSIRLNPAKWATDNRQPAIGNKQPAISETKEEGSHSPLTTHRSPIPWTEYGFYLEQRPSFTFDPFFHAGCYYVQEASSMFLEQAFLQVTDLSQPLKVLDLSAAPGGKSTHIQTLLHPESLLVSNEVIKQRSLVLTDNIIKWGASNVFVTNNDPRAFQKLPGYFDVLVVDAPCSGSGLFRKDADAISEWSLNNVALCSQRQQRILADALPALKEDGLLIYSTCSYSVEEDEEIMDWLVGEMEMESIALQVEEEWNIVVTKSNKTASAGYRFYPDKLKGEGFFLSCFRKKRGEEPPRWKASRPDTLSAKEKKVLEGWIKGEELEFLRFREGITGLPQNLVPAFVQLQSTLNIQYAGVGVGQIMKEKLVPAHALAQSLLLSPQVPSAELSYAEAIKYLQRQDLSIRPETIGWQVVRYQGQALGWINALKNRVNNYYPKEIRILKQNNKAF
jgi:16S rRNA C967 or C1407 C5-methylase (RsmB/RsmF family)/NOL1/NOP2/fmu family ribosome biogenesis protein